MSTLLERLTAIVKLRGISQRELSKRAGLNPNHVGTLLSRLRKNPDGDIERDTLAALARGGGVSLEWLAEGRDSLDSAEPTAHPNLAATIGPLGGERRLSAEGAAIVLAMGAHTPLDLAPETWAILAADIERQLAARR